MDDFLEKLDYAIAKAKEDYYTYQNSTLREYYRGALAALEKLRKSMTP